MLRSDSDRFSKFQSPKKEGVIMEIVGENLVGQDVAGAKSLGQAR